MPQPETPTARATEESRPVTEPTDLTGARTTMLLALRLGGVNREDAESVLADYDATVREQTARDVETIAAAAAKSLIPRPRVERGEFMNDWEWAAAIARTPQRAAVSAPGGEAIGQ